jgi:hypothetical protein
MIDLLIKDLPCVGYPLVARIWEHFDVAAPYIVFLSVLYYGDIFLKLLWSHFY